ncbi:hypothetical protein [Citreicella sp. C3M06]|nr:hypothetical protein [Citreicella sp. C3M06]
MPQPVLIGSTFYLRLHVPTDVASKASETTVAIPVAERISQA